MNLWRLVIRSLVWYRRTGIVVLLGIAIATAVITGALLVGDSVSGSLRDIARARLGTIDSALVSPRFFFHTVAGDLAKQPLLTEHGGQVFPLALLRGVAQNPATMATLPQINVAGIDPDFWHAFPDVRPIEITGRGVAINAALARDVGVRVGESLLLTVPRSRAMPESSLFTARKRNDTVRTMRVTVQAILPNRGPGGFTLDAGNMTPRTLLIDREWLMTQLEMPGKVNALAVAAPSITPAQLQTVLKATCRTDEYGLRIIPNGTGHYLTLQSDGVVLPDAQVAAVQKTARELGTHASPSSMYLADTIALDRTHRELAYAMVAGLGSADHAKGLNLPRNGIALSTWAADDLGAKVGDAVTVRYLIPSWNGKYRTGTARLTVRIILDMPVLSGNPHLVPDLEGITGAARIDEWEPPFPVDLDRVTKRDEAYWEAFRATPKAFISLEAAQAMWASGPEGRQADWITALQVYTPEALSTAAFTARLLTNLSPSDAGMVFRPVRKSALAAATGKTDFGQLFLAMSFFLVVAAAGLASTLMRLQAESRATEIGMMLVSGFDERGTTRVILLEGAALTLLGVCLGVPLGALYAWGNLYALTHWWNGAVGVTDLWLHITGINLFIGGAAGLLIGLLSVGWGMRSIVRRPLLQLLAGWRSLHLQPASKRAHALPWLVGGVLLCAAGLLLAGITQLLPPVGAFFGGGTALLLVGLLASRLLLMRALIIRGTPTLPRLALRSAAAHPTRSLLAIGLLASASFLIISVAANTRDFTRANVSRRDSGAGGFTLRAVASLPIPYDFTTPEGRETLGFAHEDEALFARVRVMPFLMNAGEDISCANPARPAAPRVLGVPQAMIDRGGFQGVSWRTLNAQTPESTPAFGDASSVQWGLHSGLGKTYSVPAGNGHPAQLRFAGLLSGSIFASELLVSEAQFKQLYPGITVPRYFLIETTPADEARVAAVLREHLGELGLEVQSTREVLNSINRVQNTYLATFLALGGLGMLLGTLGLMTVLLRNAAERRREFALLLAMGFDQRFISRLLLTETAALLIAGLCIGTISALVAVAPQLIAVETHIQWGTVGGVLFGMLGIGLLSSACASQGVARGVVMQALREE